MKAFLLKVLFRGGKLVLAVLCYCLAVAHFQALALHVPGLKVGRELGALGIGLLVGGVLFSFISKFHPVYVFGHEFTHWLVAKCFRRRTQGFRVGLREGKVDIENPNLWITLAPYFVPIYSVFWLLGLGLWALFAEEPPWYAPVLFAGLGFSYAYHLVMTVYAIRQDQPDLKCHGRFFSFGLILWLNAALLGWGLALVSAQPAEYGRSLLQAGNFQLQCALAALHWLWGLVSAA